MSEPVRFDFASDFGPGAPGGGALGDEAAHRLRHEAEAVGYARGFDDGRASEEIAAVRRLAEAAETVSARLIACERLLEARLVAIEADAAALALSFARTLTLGLVPDAALVEEAFRLALGDLTNTLALTITINPRVLPAVDERLATMASGVNPGMRIRLVSDRAMRLGDCSIAWPDGEISASRTAREERLAALLASAFPKSQTLPAEPLP